MDLSDKVRAKPLVTFAETAKSYALRQEDVAGARLVMDRNVMLEYLPKQAVVCEVGTREGHFSRRILDVTKPKRLDLIDRNWAKFEREKFLPEIENGTIFTHNRDSARGLREFAPQTFDWIYIDGDHRYKGVKRDIEAAVERVKSNGYLVFNDYIGWTRRGTQYGVIRAVNELCVDWGWKVVMIALQRGGYNDVVVRRKEFA